MPSNPTAPIIIALFMQESIIEYSGPGSYHFDLYKPQVERHGAAGLAVRASPGRPAKLRAGEHRRLVKILLKGSLAQGYTTDLWTTSRIATVIRKTFRVTYHPDHVGRLLHQLKWTHQKPETRAVERDEAAIEHWTRVDWPRVKKTPGGWAPSSSSSTSPGSC